MQAHKVKQHTRGSGRTRDSRSWMVIGGEDYVIVVRMLERRTPRGDRVVVPVDLLPVRRVQNGMLKTRVITNTFRVAKPKRELIPTNFMTSLTPMRCATIDAFVALATSPKSSNREFISASRVEKKLSNRLYPCHNVSIGAKVSERFS